MDLRRFLNPTSVALALLVLILAIAAGGTAFAFLTGSPGFRPSGPPSEPLNPTLDLGAFRGKTADPEPRVFAVRIALECESMDADFRDEYLSKEAEIRSICSSFLGSKTAERLSPGFEGALKAELRDTVNANLSLGKIKNVYFYDMTVIE